MPEHRQNKRSHPLTTALALATCALLCGGRSLYAAAFEAALARCLAQAQPSAAKGQRQAVAMDGKALRGS